MKPARIVGLLCMLTVILASLCCSGSPPPAAPENKDPLEVKDETEETLATLDLGKREAASLTAYVHAAYPGSLVQGAAPVCEKDNFHLLSLEISLKEGGTKTVDLVTRVFTHPDGTQYWKAEPLSPDLEQIARILFSQGDKTECSTWRSAGG
jgi:hypothetical protein